MDYEKRLKIPVAGDPERQFYTRSGALIAKGYMRVCIGARSPYIEFREDHIVKGVLEEQKDKKKAHYYFREYRTVPDHLFVYYQLHPVDYADYRVGFYYISPFDLCSLQGIHVIEPLRGGTGEQLKLFP